MKKPATFRRVTAQDAVLLARLDWQSFEEAFGAANAPENIAAFKQDSTLAWRLEEALKKTACT